jgi:hypothetical protein
MNRPIIISLFDYSGGWPKPYQDFIENSGYADDMKESVTLEIAGMIADIINKINEFNQATGL